MRQGKGCLSCCRPLAGRAATALLPAHQPHLLLARAAPGRADAIRALGALRVETNQLRQLNKFLEVRIPP